ncbi:MAG: ThuA domain-containing protein [Verrucomicrobiota bacterium]
MNFPSSFSARNRLRLAAPLFAVGCFLTVAVLVLGCRKKDASAQSAEPKKIVFVAGPPSHPSGQHEFFAGSTILARALEDQSGLPIKVEVVQNGWPEDESVFDGADAIVIYSDGRGKHPIQGNELSMGNMIAKGVGLMCMHYAVDVAPGGEGMRFQEWIGGYYENGFSVNPHWTADSELDPEHAISRGVPSFTVNDEWYYNMRFADPDTARHILTAVPTKERINRYISWTAEGKAGLGKPQTLLWAVERSDGGRGVGFTGGHWHRNWAIEEYRKLVLNAVVWIAGAEVPEGGVSSEQVTETQLNENLDEKKEMVHVSLPSESDLWQAPASEKPIGKPKKPKGKAKPKAKANS